MPLVESQQIAHDEIIRLLRAGERRIKLIGSAGTGKTFLSQEIVRTIMNDKTILKNRTSGLIYATAPTNKALAVLMGKIQLPIEFSTVHSAVKVTKKTNDKTGEESFDKRKYGKMFEDPFRDTTKFALIDECSMLEKRFIGYPNEDNSYYTAGWLEDYNFPIIFIGDDKQLNPVNEDISQIWARDYPTVRLTEIVRQGKGNPIIALSNNLEIAYSKEPHLIGSKGYMFSNDRASIIEELAEVNGTDELKYLSYTNTDVDSINKMVREKIYTKPRKIEKGETLVFDKPYGSYYTNQEVKVEELDIVIAPISVPRHDSKFDTMCQPISALDHLKMKFYRINDSFNIVHEDSEALFNDVSQIMKVNCDKYGWGYRGKNYFIDQFAHVKYNHAITVHKSQGSTYKTSIINIGNMLINRDIEERKRLLYTGITRASDLVILNNVK